MLFTVPKGIIFIKLPIDFPKQNNTLLPLLQLPKNLIRLNQKFN